METGEARGKAEGLIAASGTGGTGGGEVVGVGLVRDGVAEGVEDLGELGDGAGLAATGVALR